MIKLSDISTKPPKNADKKTLKEETKKYAKRLGELQAVLRAEQKHSVLVIFQGMDASGKDGAVKNVFKYCLHDGVSVHSFKKPTDEEFAHDFLWRVHKKCPAKGQVQIFNRSHYEDILIQRVHGWISEERVEKRMNAINAFEDLLTFDNNTVVLKFFLHLSKKQQKLELEERLNEPDKYWKHNDGDWEQRKHWNEYMRCYEDVLNWSKTPWTIVPVDERWYRDYVVSKAIVEALEALKMSYPEMKE